MTATSCDERLEKLRADLKTEKFLEMNSSFRMGPAHRTEIAAIEAKIRAVTEASDHERVVAGIIRSTEGGEPDEEQRKALDLHMAELNRVGVVPVLPERLH